MLVDWVNWIQPHLKHPYELGFGEGVVWQQANMIWRGEGYSDIYQEPYIVFHYPPVFHLVTGMVEQLGGNFVKTGRLVSVFSMLVLATTVFFIVLDSFRKRCGAWPSVFCALLTALLLFTQPPLIAFSPLSRVDMLGFALGLMGAYWGLKSLQRSAYIYLAVIFFTLSIFTKHIFLVIPTALFTMLLLVDTRLAIRGLLAGLIIAVSASIVAVFYFGVDFFTHLLAYNINRWEPENFRYLVNYVLVSKIPLGLALVFVVLQSKRVFEGVINFGYQSFCRNIRQGQANALKTFVLIYLALSAAFSLSIGKSGAHVNYLFELSLASSLAVACLITPLVASALSDPQRKINPPSKIEGGSLRIRAFGMFSIVLLAFHFYTFNKPQVTLSTPGYDVLNKLLEVTDKPIISDDMVWLLVNGREVIWESAIFRELEAKNTWNPDHFLKRMRNRDFGFFVTERYNESTRLLARYSDRLVDALDTHYPTKRSVGRFTVHLPSDFLFPDITN